MFKMRPTRAISQKHCVTEALPFLPKRTRRFRQQILNVSRLFIGNLPDRDRAHLFYPLGKDYTSKLKDHAAQIGIWRSEAELYTLAANEGWELTLTLMPPEFYAAHYRFDALLTPKARL